MARFHLISTIPGEDGAQPAADQAERVPMSIASGAYGVFPGIAPLFDLPYLDLQMPRPSTPRVFRPSWTTEEFGS